MASFGLSFQPGVDDVNGFGERDSQPAQEAVRMISARIPRSPRFTGGRTSPALSMGMPTSMTQDENPVIRAIAMLAGQSSQPQSAPVVTSGHDTPFRPDPSRPSRPQDMPVITSGHDTPSQPAPWEMPGHTPPAQSFPVAPAPALQQPTVAEQPLSLPDLQAQAYAANPAYWGSAGYEPFHYLQPNAASWMYASDDPFANYP